VTMYSRFMGLCFSNIYVINWLELMAVASDVKT
jgi:hypothetical protein